MTDLLFNTYRVPCPHEDELHTIRGTGGNHILVLRRGQAFVADVVESSGVPLHPTQVSRFALRRRCSCCDARRVTVIVWVCCGRAVTATRLLQAIVQDADALAATSVPPIGSFTAADRDTAAQVRLPKARGESDDAHAVLYYALPGLPHVDCGKRFERTKCCFDEACTRGSVRVVPGPQRPRRQSSFRQGSAVRLTGQSMVRQDATVCGVPQPGSSRAGRGTSCSLLPACGVHNSLASRRGGEQHSATDGAPVAEMMAWMVSSAASKAARSLVDASPGGLNTSAGTDGGLLAPQRLPFTRTAALNDLVGCCVASLATAGCFTLRALRIAACTS